MAAARSGFFSGLRPARRRFLEGKLMQGQPWSDQDVAIMADLIATGYPPAAIAQRLDRTRIAVVVRARLLGLPIRSRTQRCSVHICLAPDVFAQLKTLAERRGINSRTHTGSVAVMTRIIVELVVRDNVLCGNLLDDIEQ
jgi:hypothetical protein